MDIYDPFALLQPVEYSHFFWSDQKNCEFSIKILVCADESLVKEVRDALYFEGVANNHGNVSTCVVCLHLFVSMSRFMSTRISFRVICGLR